MTYQVTDDYYQILGVQQSAGKDAIRASYKRLAMLHHPDRNPNNPKATAQFQLIESAYSTLFDPDRRRIYDVQYASIRVQRGYTADTSSKSNPAQRASDQKSRDSQTFKEQIERLGAALQQLYLRRSKLESGLFEIKREYNRSRAALDKLQSEADKDAQEEAGRKSWLGYYFSARESEEAKEERQRRMINNIAARRVREAELNSRKSAMGSKERSIDALNELMRQKNAEKDKLLLQERAREEAVRREEMRQREAARREKERQERERQERERKEKERQERERREKERKERERKEKERKEHERRENERKEDERRERERIEKIQRGLRELFETLQTEQEPPRFRNPPQPKKAGKARQANANTNANRGTKPNTRRRGNEFNSESTSSKQPAGATTSKTGCLHRSWWDREEGKHVCERCTTTTFRFAFRCPGCRTVACAKCRDVMKSKRQMPEGPLHWD